MSKRICVRNPGIFCCTCGEYTLQRRREKKNIDDFLEKAYFVYFSIKLGDKGKKYRSGVRLDFQKLHKFGKKMDISSIKSGHD